MSGETVQQVPNSAASAVDLGLTLFKKGRMRDALEQFDSALKMNPSPDEALAAYYNKACCHASREESEKASEALRIALRDYNLKFSDILSDPDMAPFRATPQFKALQDEARKGGEDIGGSFRRDLKLISEVQAPFRAVRKFFYIAFGVGAGTGTFFTLPRLLLAIQGGDNAPNLLETVQNLGVNIGGVVLFVALYIWDNRKEEEQIARITRDETLSRLPVRLSNNRIVELVQLRGTTRPIILAGSKDSIARAVQKAGKYRKELLKRGVMLVPLEWSAKKEMDVKKKKGFGKSLAVTDEFQKRAQDVAMKAVIDVEKRFEAEIVSQREWERWVCEQQDAEGVRRGEEVYVVLRLDGRIRKSGRGMPDWEEVLKELPVVDALLSKLEK